MTAPILARTSTFKMALYTITLLTDNKKTGTTPTTTRIPKILLPATLDLRN
jgi:hypothetical protein